MTSGLTVIGVSAFFHNSAAAVSRGGQILAAIEEERLSRRKNDAGFPQRAIEICLTTCNLNPSSVSAVSFYERPLLRAFRPLGHSNGAERGLKAALEIREVVDRFFGKRMPIYFFPHHLSHAASAFLPSPFEAATVIVIDAVGELTSASIWRAGTSIELLWEEPFPHSIGLLYSFVTDWLGFSPLNDEFKVMGLAAYAQHNRQDAGLKELASISSGGSLQIAPVWLDTILKGGPAGAEAPFHIPKRLPGTPIGQEHANLAADIQDLTSSYFRELMLKAAMLNPQSRNLCLAGGVAHNCAAIGQNQDLGAFDGVFVQPAAGDAGAALGASLLPHFLTNGRAERKVRFDPYLGPAYSDDDYLEAARRSSWQPFHYSGDLFDEVSQALVLGKVIGWFQDRSEFGPRALGNRSILASPLLATISARLNSMIKERESFRPFAPAAIAERVHEFFEGRWIDPYMMVTGKVRSAFANQLQAITHVDGTARVQVVHKCLNPKFHQLIENFGRKSGFPLLLNTSLNHSSEPMACSPRDAFSTADRCRLDVLVLGCFLFVKQ